MIGGGGLFNAALPWFGWVMAFTSFWVLLVNTISGAVLVLGFIWLGSILHFTCLFRGAYYFILWVCFSGSFPVADVFFMVGLWVVVVLCFYPGLALGSLVSFSCDFLVLGGLPVLVVFSPSSFCCYSGCWLEAFVKVFEGTIYGFFCWVSFWLGGLLIAALPRVCWVTAFTSVCFLFLLGLFLVLELVELHLSSILFGLLNCYIMWASFLGNFAAGGIISLVGVWLMEFSCYFPGLPLGSLISNACWFHVAGWSIFRLDSCIMVVMW